MQVERFMETMKHYSGIVERLITGRFLGLLLMGALTAAFPLA